MSHFLWSLLGILNEMSPYILLGFLIAGVLHEFVKPSMMSRHLAGNGIGPVVKAALFGIPLPLCSCGVLPTAVSLRRNGASGAAATSFLIATPQTGVDSIAATYSLLGPAFAIVRPVAALLGAMVGGLSVGRFAPTSMTAGDDGIGTCGDSCCATDGPRKSFVRKVLGSIKYGFVDMVASVGKWLVIGLVVAAAITVFVPDELFLSLAAHPVLAMLVMVAVAIPMYICATGSIPIALSLMLKGLTPGVAFVLLMAGPAANFASVMVLKKAMGTRATALYIGSVIVTALAIGMAIDYILPASWFALPLTQADVCCHESLGVFDTICSIILAGLLIYALVFYKGKGHHSHSHNQNTDYNTNKTEMTTRVYKIKGMMCPHCQANVHNGLSSLKGVENVEVNLSYGTATVTGDAAPADIISKIESLGYDYIGEYAD